MSAATRNLYEVLDVSSFGNEIGEIWGYRLSA